MGVHGRRSLQSVGVIFMSEYGKYRDWKGWSEKDFAQTSRTDDVYFAQEIRRAGLPARAGLAVLEIGFGNGRFAGWAKKQGWRYIGTEQDPALVARARAAGFDANPAATPLEQLAGAGTLGLVVAFDVLEHLTIDDGIELLRSARKLLAADGIFLARFPSGDSPFGRAIQHGDRTHRTAIGSGMVQQMALESGFDVARIAAPALPIFGVGLVSGFRRALIRAIRAAIGSVLRKAYFDNQPRVVDPNMIIVLRRSG